MKIFILKIVYMAKAISRPAKTQPLKGVKE
jgi:hypothetical protein